MGMPRKPPKINAHGMSSTQAIIPKVKSQILRTGSFNAPMNEMAMTRCPKASQSKP